MMQNSPIRTPGPMTASDETTAVGAITADGSMAMNSYDKRRWNQTGRQRHGGAGAGAEGRRWRRKDLTDAAPISRRGCWFPRGFRRLAWRGSICRSEEHTSELQSLRHLVCRLLLEKKK